jgi:hypothetical protein
MGQSEINNFLKANSGTWFTIDMLARTTGMQISQTSKCLNKMLAFDDLFGLETKSELEQREGNKRVFTIKYFRINSKHAAKHS